MRFDIWKIVFLIGFALYVGIRGLFESRAKQAGKREKGMDSIELALLIPVGVSSLLLPLVYIFTNWLSFADYAVPDIVSFPGITIMVIALFLFYRSHADLGTNWSATLALRSEHELVTNGIYQSVRHPMYSSIFLWNIAQGMLLHNWFAGWSAFVAFTLLYIVRVPREERMMYQHFGNEYKAYMNRTGRIFPKLWARR